jgi:hypothetical protein
MTPSGQEPAAYETTGDMAVAAHPRANFYPQTFVHSTPVSLRQLSGSTAFPRLRRHAPALPSRASIGVIVGPLGLGSPRVSDQSHRWLRPAVLCVATTAFALPGRFAFSSVPVPWVDALAFVSLPARAGAGSSAGRVCQCTPRCLFCRSPLLRPLLPRRREALPSSRITPLNTCPALRPRWCPTRLPWRGQDCCLPIGADRRLSDWLPSLIL